MSDEWILILGVAQAIFFGLLGVIGFFIRGLIADLKTTKEEKDKLETTVAVLQARMESRDDKLADIDAGVRGILEDMRWVRDRIQRLPCRKTKTATCDSD
jgi:hypothetical protein